MSEINKDTTSPTLLHVVATEKNIITLKFNDQNALDRQFLPAHNDFKIVDENNTTYHADWIFLNSAEKTIHLVLDQAVTPNLFLNISYTSNTKKAKFDLKDTQGNSVKNFTEKIVNKIAEAEVTISSPDSPIFITKTDKPEETETTKPIDVTKLAETNNSTSMTGISMGSSNPNESNSGINEDSVSSALPLDTNPPFQSMVAVSDTDNNSEYSTNDTISLIFSEPINITSLKIVDFILANDKSFGKNASLVFNSNKDTATITLGVNSNLLKEDTIILSSNKVIDLAGNMALENVIFSLPKISDYLNYSLDGQGTEYTAFLIDASTGSINFIDDIKTTNNVIISNFGVDDKITITDSTTLNRLTIDNLVINYDSGITSSNSDVELSFNNDGKINTIVLSGVTSTPVYDVATFNNLSLGGIYFN